ncbi:MAG: hypothetical protein Kow00108_19010 [Calditrichia bacterium]
MRSIFQKIFKKLFSISSLKGLNVSLENDDLLNQGISGRGSTLFLGTYTMGDIDYALKKYGIYSHLKQMGFYPVKIHTQFSEVYKQRIVLYIDDLIPDNILAELVIQKKQIKLNFGDYPKKAEEPFLFLVIEWLLLQNPKGVFTTEKLQLPGQEKPGLGIGKSVLHLLSTISKQIFTAGLINYPEHLHNGVMYSKKFKFISPEKSGIVKKLMATIGSELGLGLTSWAVELGCINMNGQLFNWEEAPQVIPRNAFLNAYFSSDYYRELEDRAYADNSFSLDKNLFKTKLAKLNIGGLDITQIQI